MFTYIQNSFTDENIFFSLLEKGRQILMKDDLIDEEKARQEEAAHETLNQKIDRYNNRTCKI